MSSNQWEWHKKFSAGSSSSEILTVSGLAVDTTGSQLAVHVTRTHYSDQWVFVLDTASGQSLSS